jgi:hypothetical protein
MVVAMRIYEIEVCAIGTYTAVNPFDKSGCSDVDVDCWQEATFTVAAESIEDAVAMVYKDYERLNRDYTNTCDTLYYNPAPLSVGECEGCEPEILDYHFNVPKDGDGATDAPERYSIEV